MECKISRVYEPGFFDAKQAGWRLNFLREFFNILVDKTFVPVIKYKQIFWWKGR
ncbi:hypothetical protein HMPREF3213_02942 [Heyndrickxia coagulans]|uniref:Uncharacterized protein n=1 Tax=Heyndrickxia coagulans TaxID=1398 RepID=A0A133KGM6_HEYCO|nr:hypothetical protein HMPREF3213_02942 [Heyndrickxia coagulans]